MPETIRELSNVFQQSLFWCLVFAAASQADEFPNPDSTNLPPRTLIAGVPHHATPEWLQKNLRIGHLPGYNDRMVKEFLKAGYNVVTVNCLDNWDHVGPGSAWYTPEKAQQADAYLRRVVDTIHAAGARCVFYIGPVQCPLFSKELRAAHPDWLRVKADGSKDENFGNIRNAYGDWLCEQLAYVTRIYKVDGFWFDGYAPGHLHTYDSETRRKFREYCGQEIPQSFDPVKNPIARKYLAWHEQYFVEFAARMREAIRREKQDCVIFANYSANRTWYYPDQYMGEYPATYCRAIDVSSVELYWDVPGDALYQQFCYAFVQSTTHGRCGTVWIQPQLHGISGVATPLDIQLRGLEGVPWGVYPEFVESALREEYLKQHVANVKSREKWWSDSEPIPYIGIVASEQTRALYAQGALPVYFSHTLGAFKAIFEKHWPVRVLTEYDLEDGDLRGVRVLMLPNVACMSNRSAEVVRRYVRSGGGLVASYETSLYDENFERRPDFALADLFGAEYKASHVVTQRDQNLYISAEADHPIVRDPVIAANEATAWMGGDGPPPAHGKLTLIASAVEAKPKPGAQVLATFQPNVPDLKEKFPAVIASEFGQGRVVYFPASIDKGLFFYPAPYMRQMLANACRWAAKETAPPIEVQGPLLLAATARRQPSEKRTIVHLLNDHSSYGRHSIYQKVAPLPKELEKKWGFPDRSELRGTWPIREELIPLHDIKVICRVPGVTKATLEPEHIDLPMQKRGGEVEIIVPRLEIHSMVVFE